MMNVLHHWGRRTIAPITVSYWASSSFGNFSQCDEVTGPKKEEESTKPVSSESPSSSSLKPSDEKEEYFHNLFPKRQLWEPKKEYPLWYAYFIMNFDEINETHYLFVMPLYKYFFQSLSPTFIDLFSQNIMFLGMQIGMADIQS